MEPSDEPRADVTRLPRRVKVNMTDLREAYDPESITLLDHHTGEVASFGGELNVAAHSLDVDIEEEAFEDAVRESRLPDREKTDLLRRADLESRLGTTAVLVARPGVERELQGYGGVHGHGQRPPRG
jgi:hypothetical protein